tara:strand:- start:66 stop:314 length:249 start_codon:yes stop_codon:yes gene_type:complete
MNNTFGRSLALSCAQLAKLIANTKKAKCFSNIKTPIKKRLKKNVPPAYHYTKHLDRQEISKDGKTTDSNNARLIKTSERDEK